MSAVTEEAVLDAVQVFVRTRAFPRWVARVRGTRGPTSRGTARLCSAAPAPRRFVPATHESPRACPSPALGTSGPRQHSPRTGGRPALPHDLVTSRSFLCCLRSVVRRTRSDLLPVFCGVLCSRRVLRGGYELWIQALCQTRVFRGLHTLPGRHGLAGGRLLGSECFPCCILDGLRGRSFSFLHLCSGRVGLAVNPTQSTCHRRCHPF